MVLPSSPSKVTRLCGSCSADSWCGGNGAVRFLTQTSRLVVQCQPWFYPRLFAYRFFWLSEGGIRFHRETWCPKHPHSLTGLWILTLEPERLENQPAMAGNESRDGLSTDAQAACCFRCSASKRAPFFQTIKVMAAILRARVRRAIAGFVPLATKAA